MRAQKKPVVIDFLPFYNNILEVQNWVETFNEDFSTHFKVEGNTLKVKTLEGISYDVTTSDVIIRGVKGEYYPCKKDIFEETYETIE